MVEKVEVAAGEGLTGAVPTKPVATEGADRPSWLPENFKSPEDLLNSYKNLQGDYTKKSQELAALKKTGEEGKPEGSAEDQAREAATKAGISEDEMAKYSEEFWSSGKISDETYAALEAKGFTRELVDQFAAGQQAIYEGQRNALLNAGGGEEKVNEMLSWAAKGLDPKAVDALNKQFDSPDPNTQLLAMETLKARYEAANGFAPSRTVNGLPTSTSGDVYASVAQVQADMSDRRYQTDPAFRAAVAAKLGRSNVL